MDLVQWIKDERVLADTWVFSRRTNTWQQAFDMSELKANFCPKTGMTVNVMRRIGIAPGALRRIRLFGSLNDAQLEHLSGFLETQRVGPGDWIVKQGEPGGAMYFVIEGELRARTMQHGAEMLLATFSPGDFFGAISLLDDFPRSADVIANTDSTLLRISAPAFERLTCEAPALATPFLQATARIIASGIRADYKSVGQAMLRSASRGL
jgi:CRP/FNR family cyclic AMP-dependent transcriptional regulator